METPVHHDFPAGRVTLHRQNGALFVTTPHGTVQFSTAAIIHSKVGDTDRQLSIDNWSTTYRVDPWSDSLTEMGEEEDIDFGLMLANIRDDHERMECILNPCVD